ncbi:hypothetical protein GGR55DRAFT_674211 [Xylaria sp. FL0064]|nr:hypothetical protein GGR55DRAFT_674211 [Xylaria sp. FL0064]
MTHDDARINVNLAKASKELAKEAKKDSSSMKSIAIMTMLFLLGTHFTVLWGCSVTEMGARKPDPVRLLAVPDPL